MDDGLIFPYRRSTAHADARVLTHAAGRVRALWCLRVPWGPAAGGLGTLRAGRQAC